MSYVRFVGMTAPGNAPAGRLYLYVDSADGHVKTKDEDGVVTDISTGGAASVTELDITGTIVPGTAFSTIASGASYTKSGDNGNLGLSEAFFNNSLIIQLELNGVRFDKSDDITWITSQSFSLVSTTVDSGDKITIYS